MIRFFFHSEQCFSLINSFSIPPNHPNSSKRTGPCNILPTHLLNFSHYIKHHLNIDTALLVPAVPPGTRAFHSSCCEPYGDRRCVVYRWCIQSYASWLTCKLDPAAGVNQSACSARDLSAVQYTTTAPVPVLSDCLYFLSLFITRLRRSI